MKFNVGDKVRIKEDLSQCKFGGSTYMNEYAGKEATVTETYDSGLIQLDIDDGEWNWSEGVLELIEDSEKKMRRIDYVLNAKDPIKVLVEEFDLGLDCCKCHYDDECDGISVNCNDGFIKYLEQEIEVNESNLKDVDAEPIDINVEDTNEQIDRKEVKEKVLDEVKEQLLKTKGKIIDIKEEPEKNDPVNHPSHYTDTKIEVMDYIEDKGFNFALGNAVKYISRAGKKDKNKTIQDLEKAEWYLNREIERLKKLQGDE